MKKMHKIGEIINFKNKPHIIVNHYMSGELHILGIVKLYTHHLLFLRIKYVTEEYVKDYDTQ